LQGNNIIDLKQLPIIHYQKVLFDIGVACQQGIPKQFYLIYPITFNPGDGDAFDLHANCFGELHYQYLFLIQDGRDEHVLCKVGLLLAEIDRLALALRPERDLFHEVSAEYVDCIETDPDFKPILLDADIGCGEDELA
jgi:hypothetical protein